MLLLLSEVCDTRSDADLPRGNPSCFQEGQLRKCFLSPQLVEDVDAWKDHRYCGGHDERPTQD